MRASDLSKLVRSGGNFKGLLKRGVNTSGQIRTLSNNKAAVEKLEQIVKLGKNRGLSNSIIREGIKKIGSAGENFTATDRNVTKEILEGLSAKSYKEDKFNKI